MALLKLNDKPIVLKNNGGASPSTAGYKVTFPATATNWDKITQAGLFQFINGNVVYTDMVNYSNVAGKSFDNVAIFVAGSTNYYGISFTVNGSIGIYSGDAFNSKPSTNAFPVYTNTTARSWFTSTPQKYAWIPLSDIVITNLSAYDTD